MKGALTRYRVMAAVVGVLLVVLCLVGVPLHYGYQLIDAAWLAPPAIEGEYATAGTGWRIGNAISAYLGVAHGWLYMIFLLTAFMLARRADWSLRFTLLIMVCGTIPLASFWAERVATARARESAPA